jgi:hypothetical protein
MSVITLTVKSKNQADVTTYSENFETDFMRDIITNPDSQLNGGAGTAFSYPDTSGGYDTFVVSEALSGITSGSGTLKRAVLDLTAAQIKTLNATPLDVVAAPGAGKALIPISGYVSLDATATAFATNVDLEIIVEDETNSFFFADTCIDGTTDKITAFKLTTLGSTNNALQVTNLNGEPATGTGTAQVVLFYQEVTL